MANPLIVGAGGCVAALPSLVNRLVSAYETSKRIEFETRKLKVQGRLAEHALQIKRAELENRHREQMKSLDMAAQALTQFLVGVRAQVQDAQSHQKMLRESFSRLTRVITQGKASPELVSRMMACARDILTEIETCADRSSRRLNEQLLTCGTFLSKQTQGALGMQTAGQLPMKEGV